MTEYVIDMECVRLRAQPDTIARWERFVVRVEDGRWVFSTPIPATLKHWRSCASTRNVETLEEQPVPITETQRASDELEQGLGDTVEKWIQAARLDKLAELYERLSGKKCRCPARKALLNRLFPYRRQHTD
jgi:hypothetical protein